VDVNDLFQFLDKAAENLLYIQLEDKMALELLSRTILLHVLLAAPEIFLLHADGNPAGDVFDDIKIFQRIPA